MARSTLRIGVPVALVAAASAWLASIASDTADWAIDAWPAVRSLASGDLSGYLHAHALMGPFSTLVQAPLAAFAGASELAAYRLAAIPCLFAVGLLGLYLATVARRRGASVAGAALLPVLCLFNPLVLEAISNGHPEEVLTAALAVGAVAAACEGRAGWTAALLGLALGSKQWAVVAVLPALMALPAAARVRTGLWAVALVAALNAPAAIASPGGFLDVYTTAAGSGRIVAPLDVWYPVAETATEVLHVGGATLVAERRVMPALLGSLAHALIVASVVLVPLAAAVRRRRFGLSAEDAMALLAALALLRCALDPVDNLYYNLPVLVSLLALDAAAGERYPVRGIVATTIAALFWAWSRGLQDVDAFSLAYVAVALAATAALLRGPLRKYTDFSLYDAQISGIKSAGKLSMKTG